MCLPRLGWSLQEVYQGVCTYCTATQWPFNWGRSQQDIWVCIAFRRCPKDFQSPETGMFDSPCVGLCQLYEVISTRDRCIQGWARGSAVPKTGRWKLSPSHLWEQSPYASLEELPLNQAWVFSIEMGGYQTFQGVPALSTLPDKDRQQSIDLHNDDIESWCYLSPMGWSPCPVQFRIRIPERMW